MPKELYDFKADLIHETDKALLLDVDGKEIWFPKSIIQDNDDGTYTVPEKFAIEKEIV